MFLAQARAILAAMEEAEETIRIRRQKPAGRLCVDAASPFMLHCVVPHVAEFRGHEKAQHVHNVILWHIVQR